MERPEHLKIGMVCYPLIGGSGILATELGHELAKRGHQVHFFSYAQPIRLHAGLPGIHFHAVEVNEYNLFRYPDYTLPLAVRMAEVARSEELDLWHVHYAVPHATAAFLARSMIGPASPAIVTTLHGTDTTLLGQDPNYQAAIEHALAGSDCLTTVSESLRRETESTFRISRPLAVVPNFYEPEPTTRTREEVRESLGIGGDERMVLHMSNLRSVKRIDLLFETIARAETRSRLRLVLLAGANGASWLERARSCGLGDIVMVRENVGDVENYLQAADLALYTSETESFGLSILESMHFGLPVVAFRVGGIPEVVVDGENGFLHPFGDTAAMARSVDRLAGDAGLRQQMGAAGRRRAREHFTAGRVVPQYEQVYRQALEIVAGQGRLRGDGSPGGTTAPSA